MGEKNDLAVLRFVSQRRAAKVESPKLAYDAPLQVAIPQPGSSNNEFRNLPFADSRGGRQSRSGIAHGYERPYNGLNAPRDAFDTDVEDADDTSVFSPAAMSPSWVQDREERVKSPGSTHVQGTVRTSVESTGGSQPPGSLSFYHHLEDGVSVWTSESALTRMNNGDDLHLKSRLVPQAGFGNGTPWRQRIDGSKRSPQYLLNPRASPYVSNSNVVSAAVEADSQKIEFRDTRLGRRLMPTPQVASPSPTPPRMAQTTEDDAAVDFTEKELTQHSLSAKRQTALGNDSDLESQSSLEEEEKEEPLKRLDEARSSKRKRSLDYTPDELARMTYSSLKDESFDTDPKTDDHGLPAKLVNGAVSEKLQYAFSCRNNAQKAMQRTMFFSSLSIEEHEECGDLIIEKFGEALARFKMLRQQKRALCKDFEDEIEQRYYLIEAKKDAIEYDFKMMRTKGNDIVTKKASGEAISGTAS